MRFQTLLLALPAVTLAQANVDPVTNTRLVIQSLERLNVTIRAIAPNLPPNDQQFARIANASNGVLINASSFTDSLDNFPTTTGEAFRCDYLNLWWNETLTNAALSTLESYFSRREGFAAGGRTARVRSRLSLERIAFNVSRNSLIDRCYTRRFAGVTPQPQVRVYNLTALYSFFISGFD